MIERHMNNFLRQNWFKLAIALGVLVVAGTASWYFVYQLPHQNQIKADQAQQQWEDQQAAKLKAAAEQAAEEKAQAAAASNDRISDTSEMEQSLQDIRDSMQQQQKDKNTEVNCVANGGRYGGGGLCLYY